MSGLKFCPFCGREVRIKRYVEEIDYDICWIEHVEVEPPCFLSRVSGYVGKQEDLIELWNRRTQRPDCDSANHNPFSGKCCGYGKSEYDDEPIDICKNCSKYDSYGVDDEYE